VAVIDTGITPTHPDLQGKIAAQYDFAHYDPVAEETSDIYEGHGTHVSGTVGASTNNRTGVAGTCPDCQILMAKYWDDTQVGTTDKVMEAINWSVTNEADVINMSFAIRTASVAQERAVNDAWNAGVVLVAAAGNSSRTDGTAYYPAAYQNVIAVADTYQNDQRTSFSNAGDWVDVAAPGTGVLSTFPTISAIQ